MIDDNYKKALSQIRADEKWKTELKEKIYLEVKTMEKQENACDTYINKKKQIFIKVAVSFTCLCFLISGMVVYHELNLEHTYGIKQPILNHMWIMEFNDLLQKQINEQLAILQLSEDEFTSGGMGFEGYALYHADELLHHNPYDVTKTIRALPVFQNLQVSGRFGMDEILRYSPEEENELLESYANQLGISEYKIEEREFSRILISDECEIQIDSKDRIIIYFSNNNLVNSKVFNKGNQSKERVIEQIQQLIKQPKFKGLFDETKINIDVQMQYDFYYESQTYEPSWEIKVSDKEGSQVDQLVNNQLKAIEISIDENNYLTMVINLDSTIKKMSDYPIITLEEAKQRLMNGNYYTSSWEPGDIENISYIEMVYHKNKALDYFMPYYKFYMPSKNQDMIIKHDENIILYIAYYVPAIQSDYLQDMPINQPLK